MQKTTNYLLSFIELQLFITIMSLPILILWGIPISLLSFAGNLLFSPVITCFLFLSSLIFFCEITYLPSTPLIYALAKLSSLWSTLLQTGSLATLVGHALPHKIVLCALPISIGLFLYNKKYSKTRTYRIIGYLVIMLSFYTYVLFFQKIHAPIVTLEYLKKKVFILHDKEHVAIVDTGALGRSSASSSWSEYTLIPEIIKKTGQTKIDVLILVKPGKITFDVVKELCSKIIIKKIYLIMFTGTLPNYYWQSFFALKKAIIQNNGILKRIGEKPITISTSPTTTLIITPQPTTVTTGPFSYNQLTIDYKIDNVSTSLV